jgi:hypothetical protein
MPNACSADGEDRMQLNERTRWYLRIQNIVFVVLVLFLLGAAGWLGERYSTEFDWTASQRNSLTEESAALLRTMHSPVEITAYASEDEMLRGAIRSLVRRYQRVKPDVELQFVNPDLSPEQARAVVLAVIGGCTAAEVSEVEKIPLGTAKTRIRSGLQKMRLAWEEDHRG